MLENEPAEAEAGIEPVETDQYPGHTYPLLLRLISASRYLFALAVLSTFVASVVLLFEGTWATIQLVASALGLAHSEYSLRTQALEIVDHFLVALVLFVMAGGFYQLLIRDNLSLPDWMRIRTPGHMERQLLGVIITVMSVDALIEMTSWDRTFTIVGYGLAVAAIIAAITLYVWVHDRHKK